MDVDNLNPKPPTSPWYKSKTAKLVALFSVSALALSGCGTVTNSAPPDGCLDEDEDGYCDDGSGRTGGSGAYFYHKGKKYFSRSSSSGITSGSTITSKPSSSTPSSGISSGTSSSGAKGGIGSSGGSSSS